MKRSFSLEQKVNVLTLLFSGASRKSVAESLRIDRREITIWELRYRRFGLDGLRRLRRCNFPEELKQEVVQVCLSGQDSFRQLAVDYNVSYSTIKNWVREAQRKSAGLEK